MMQLAKTGHSQLIFPTQHLKLTQVCLADRTDDHNELVQEREWLLHPSEKKLELSGNLFVIEDVFDGTGRVLVREAPLPHARVGWRGPDLRVTPGRVGGFDFALLPDEGEDEGVWTVLEFSGGRAGATRTLHDWQRSKRPATSGYSVPVFLSNTWGDRSQDSRICESFIMEEIEAASRLGVEVVQLDDGWQKGVTSNSAKAGELGGVWEGFWNRDPDFWQPHPVRFPDGLRPVLERARSRSLQIGLWFAPDSWNDMANWRRDADCILRLHREYGVVNFKIDSLQIATPQAARNLAGFFSAIRRESEGRIVTDLDITAGLRPGYFGTFDTGPLFVENRYSDWHNYWPHQTLRAIWKLSHWVDPRRLRMEFLNRSRNNGLYGDDPLAPACYPAETLFAMLMFCNPLGWFEVSNLPAEYFETLPGLVDLWKAHRKRIFSGNINPVGGVPDGLAYTGFVSAAPDGRSGYVLLFRELNESETGLFDMPGLDSGRADWTVLAGGGRLSASGTLLAATMPAKLGFLFGTYSVG